MSVNQQILLTDSPEVENLPDRAQIVGTGETTELTAVVKGKDRDFCPWSEKAVVTSLSSNGAGLFMRGPCAVGGLISLLVPLPRHLRRYDLDKRLYRVWGLVQY